MTLRIALAQIDCTAGAPERNAARIADACRAAVALGADIVLTPEAALHGPCPTLSDAEARAALAARGEASLAWLARELAAFPALAVLVGHRLLATEAVDGTGMHVADAVARSAAAGASASRADASAACSVLVGGQCVARVRKGDVDAPRVVELAGLRVGIVFGDEAGDLGDPAGDSPAADPAGHLAARLHGAEVLLAAAAWPAYIDEVAQREAALVDLATSLRAPLLCANAVGGADATRHDGRSFATDAFGIGQARLALAAPDLAVLELDRAGRDDNRAVALRRGPVAPVLTLEAQWHRLLRAAIADNVPGRAIVVTDGAIGGALLLALCTEVLGPERVLRAPPADPRPDDRPLLGLDRSALACRGAAPLPGWPVVGASSGIAVPAGAPLRIAPAGSGVPLPPYAPLRDLYRGEVIRLARWLDPDGGIFPAPLLSTARVTLCDPLGAPLPPCDIVDEVLRLELDEQESERRIIGRGYDPADVQRVLAAARAMAGAGNTPVGPRWRRFPDSNVKAG